MLLIGVDLGTTKTTAIAVDADNGTIVAKSFVESEGRNESPSVPGRSEWDASKVVACGVRCLKELADQLGQQASDVGAIGVTGQQHGMVVVDNSRRPLCPFVNWQDQRGNEASTELINGKDTATAPSWVEMARQRLGEEAIKTTGCQMNTGFMATTLFWMTQNDCLPSNGTACFIADLFVSELTNKRPVIEPTNAGGAGVFDVTGRVWASDLIDALGLRLDLFAEIHEANVPVGRVSHSLATELGLSSDVLVFPSIGDHQASFLGSVGNRHESILLNVGTGAQVAVFTTGFEFDAPIELRPFPLHGNLLSNVGLAGGWSYQVLESFFQQVGSDIFDMSNTERLFRRITELARQASPGADGIVTTPTFSGTRSDPLQRGTIQGLSPENFTPANLARSVIEGMARGFREAYDQICDVQTVDSLSIGKDAATIQTDPRNVLVGAGNGLRENQLLAEAVAQQFGLRAKVTQHTEEAACGAALLAGVGCGRFADLDEAGQLIEYSASI